MTIGEKIRKLREQKEWNQTILARKSELTPTAISNFESNQRKPSFETLQKLSRALGVTVDFLLSEKEYPVREDKLLSGVTQGVAEAIEKLRSLMPELSGKTIKLPLIDKIPASDQKPKINEILEWIELPREFAGDGDFLLLVKNFPMAEEGIKNGDLIIVKKQNKYSSEDIVISLINNDIILKKYLHTEKEKDNKKYKIIGKVISCLKKF